MGLSNSKQNFDENKTENQTINWNNLNTDDMSANMHDVNGFSFESNELVKKLENNNYYETDDLLHKKIEFLQFSDESSDFNSLLDQIGGSTFNNVTENNEVIENKLDQVIENKLDQVIENKLDQVGGNNEVSENSFSSSSPFISSEMYNYIINKYQNQSNMVGGASKKSKDEDSDTSSTSSASSESKSVVKEKPKSKVYDTKKVLKGNKNIKQNNKNIKQSKVNKDTLSYVSSSAHTGGSVSDSSISNENKISISSSVRTSQINLISE
jgi:hypothetical protein